MRVWKNSLDCFALFYGFIFNRLVFAETGRLSLYRNHYEKSENNNYCYVFHNLLTPPLIKGC